MDKVYRVTSDPDRTIKSASKAEHLLVKHEDGTIYCLTHQGDAKLCAKETKGSVVYGNTLDGGKYRLLVVRTKPYCGRLTLTREDEIVLERDVGIMYDAPYGADVEDIELWQRLSVEAADQDYQKRGEKAPED
jgi:hypothetical protein